MESPNGRRSRVDIWTDILEAIRIAERRTDLSPSRIQCRANVPHTRFWAHVRQMEERGLIESEPLRATREGRRFLFETNALRSFFDDEREG